MKLLTFLLILTILAIFAIEYIPSREVLAFDRNNELIAKHSAIIEQLIACESQGIETATRKNDGTIGEHSINILQFKYKTFRYYAEKYKVFDGKSLDEADWGNAWNDSYSQKLVASYMIEFEKNWQSHWKVCSQ